MGIVPKQRNKKHNFARARTLKSPVKLQKDKMQKSPQQKEERLESSKSLSVHDDQQKIELLKSELSELDVKISQKKEEIGINEEKEVIFVQNESEKVDEANTQMPKEQLKAIENEINDICNESEARKDADKVAIEKPADFWHDDGEKVGDLPDDLELE